MATVLVLVLEPRHDGRTLREGRLSSEHGVRLRVEPNVLVLDVQIFGQVHRFERLQRGDRADWSLVEG